MSAPHDHATLAAPHRAGARHPGGLSGTLSGTPSGTLRHALHAARGALQWRLLLWWALLLLLPTAVATLPWWQMLGASLDHSLYAARLAERLDLVAVADLAVVANERYGTAIGSGGGVALVLTLLLSPLLTGMTLAAARAPQRLHFMPMLAAGAAEYARLLRMLVWAMVPLGIAAALGSIPFRYADRIAETAILESDAVHASRLALLATAVLMLLAHATVDAGRAVLASDRRRTSAVAAWWAGCRLLLRRPLAVLGVYVAITAVGLIVAALLALARVHVPALGTPGTVGAIVLTQLTIVVLGAMRSARLFALLALVR